VLSYSGGYRSTSLTDVHLTALTGYDVYRRHTHSQVFYDGRRKLEIFLSDKPSLFFFFFNVWPALCCVGCMSSGHTEEERPRYGCLSALMFYPPVWYNHFPWKWSWGTPNHGGFRIHTEPWLCAPSVKERIGGMVMWSRVQVEVGVVRFSVDLTAQGLIRSPYMSMLRKGTWPFRSISLVNCVFLFFSSMMLKWKN
jgi:hypothetical protein